MADRTAAVVAILFGVATIAAGSRVLAGSDPGYVVFRALLVYNTIMGAVYIAGGLVIWRAVSRGRRWARLIFAANLVVLLTVTVLYLTGSVIAIESLVAMTFRTAVWGAIAVALYWLCPRRG